MASLRQFPARFAGLRTSCRMSAHMPALMPARTSTRSLTRSLAHSLVGAALACAATACQDAPTAPVPTHTPTVASAATRMQALTCAVDVRAHTFGCAPVTPTSSVVAHDVSGAQRTLVIGGQGVYVKLLGSAATPTSPGHDTLTVPVAVQNLLPQPLGTTDGVTYDGHGVMVFFAQAPTTTGGTGTVSVLGADSTGTFTAAGQQAFVYPQFLAGNQTTPERNWLFDVPSSVTAFTFVVFVRAQLQNESLPLAQPAHVFAATANAGIVGGVQSTCALRPGAGVYCWGTTAINGTQDSVSMVPLLVPGSAAAVALGTSLDALHACWLTGTGTAACVGDNTLGQLGDGTSNPAQTARTVQMPTGVTAYTQLALGGLHTCGLTATGAAYCWGYDQIGQLGDGTANSTATAVAEQAPAGVHFAHLGAGQVHTCGVTAAGAAYCWGDNTFGQLGSGSADLQDSVPVAVQLPGGVALAQIAGGGSFTCGLAGDGSAYCWGDNT